MNNKCIINKNNCNEETGEEEEEAYGYIDVIIAERCCCCQSMDIAAIAADIAKQKQKRNIRWMEGGQMDICVCVPGNSLQSFGWAVLNEVLLLLLLPELEAAAAAAEVSWSEKNNPLKMKCQFNIGVNKE